MLVEKSKSIEADLDLKMGIDVADVTKPSSSDNKELKISLCQKIKLVFTNITVEPIMICYILPNVMAGLATQNLSLEKACRVNLEFNEDICDALSLRNASGYNVTQEAAVQKTVATMYAYKNIIQSLLPAMLLLFIGSWSDRHNRRKPCMMLPLVGEIVTCTGLILCTYFFYQLPMEINAMTESIPPGLTGGWYCMFTGVFSYISGISSVETRTLRIGAVSLFSNVSVTIGIALSGVLYTNIGFYGVFSLALSMYITGLLYGFFRVTEEGAPVEKDSKDPEKMIIAEKEMEKKNFFADFFDLKHITETLNVAFKSGKRNRKKRICTIMVLVMVIIGPLHGEMNVMYLFVRYKFGWNEMDYSIYSTFNFIAHTLGTVFSLMFFSQFLKLDDTILGMISCFSKIFSALVYAFAPTSAIFYLGAIVEMLYGTSFIAMRSITSKLVSPEELGKINSLFGLSEALMPLIYGPMYSLVYNKTLDFMPGSFLLLGGLLTTPAVVIFFWLYKEHQKDALEEAEEKKYQEKLLLEQEHSKQDNNCDKS